MAISTMRSLCFLMFLLSDDSMAFVTLPARNVQTESLIWQKPAWQPPQSKLVTWQYPQVGVTEKAPKSPVSPRHQSYKPEQRHSLLFAAQSHPTKTQREARTLRLKRWVKSLRKVAKTLLLAALLTFSFRDSAWAVSGGRVGGSFGPSSSSRSSSPSSSSSIRSSPSTRVYYSPIRVYPSRGYHPFWDYSPTRLYNSVTYEAPALRMTPGQIVLLSGTCVLFAYGFAKARRDSDLSSALGPGVSVASITVALDVPDRDDPGCILAKLKRIAQAADTGTRQGVQTLVSNVALELLREEKSIKSAQTSSQHFSTASEAEREFQRISVQERSKFDKETINKYGGIDIGQATTQPKEAINDKATEAVITVSISIQGDRTKLPNIRTRKDVADALSRIAADAPVEDCLLSAEVLWAPEARSDRLTDEDIIADHPSLYPLY